MAHRAEGPERREELHVAVVHAAGGICHVAAATSAPELTSRVAEYVGEHLDYQLWPEDAERVRSHLSRGECEKAVGVYFEKVGRLDPERLETRRLRWPAAFEAARDAARG